MDLKKAWPHLRAALVITHCLAIVLIGLPNGRLLSKAAWETDNLKSDLSGWSRGLGKVGIRTTPEALGARVHSVVEAYVAVISVVSAPFTHYPDIAGTHQGWAMFASPQRHPAEVHVEIMEDGVYRTIYQSRSAEHTWRRSVFDHHRIRKLIGRFAREFRKNVFWELSGWIADRAFEDFPSASRVRVRLYRYDALPPARVAAGERPEGKFAESREIRRP